MKNSIFIEASTKILSVRLELWDHIVFQKIIFSYFFSISNHMVAMETSRIMKFAQISCG